MEDFEEYKSVKEVLKRLRTSGLGHLDPMYLEILIELYPTEEIQIREAWAKFNAWSSDFDFYTKYNWLVNKHWNPVSHQEMVSEEREFEERRAAAYERDMQLESMYVEERDLEEKKAAAHERYLQLKSKNDEERMYSELISEIVTELYNLWKRNELDVESFANLINDQTSEPEFRLHLCSEIERFFGSAEFNSELNENFNIVVKELAKEYKSSD